MAKKKKILFIDRDGTLILEPNEDFQVDSLEKLEFYPGIFRYLPVIYENLDYEWVMVTNQDGLGTKSFPEEDFWPVHHKMMKTFENEGVTFKEVLIDKTFPEENAATRKPRTGLLTHYMEGPYDLENSFVIGDRITDIELAKNLGAKGIWIGDPQKREELQNNGLEKYCVLITRSWKEVYQFLSGMGRKVKIERKTKETEVTIELALEGSGNTDISTGLGFFDHMLEQIGKHSGCDLLIQVKGDLHVDEHHTMEDTALALGEAFYKALGNKLGIERYGFALPMDESSAQVLIDFGGRNWLVWNTEFTRERIGDVPTEMFFHFFKSFTDTAKCNLNIKAEGENEHHKIEAIFKAFAKAIKMAIRKDPFNQTLPSTKGVIE